MSTRKLIETYYIDINNLADLLGKLVNSYRLLIGGADELNKIALSKRKDVKEALKRADELGEIIDNIIVTLEKSTHNYLDYCVMKAEFIEGKMESHYIHLEIDDELKFHEVDKS